MVDNDREPPAVENEQVLQWYRNMLTGMYDLSFVTCQRAWI